MSVAEPDRGGVKAALNSFGYSWEYWPEEMMRPKWPYIPTPSVDGTEQALAFNSSVRMHEDAWFGCI